MFKGGFRHQKKPGNAEAPYFLTHAKRFIPNKSLDRYNELYERYSQPDFKTANISYYYDYEGSPNEGYCWIDDLEIGEKIKTIPEDPIREGYEFAGWYKAGQEEPFNFTAYTKDENELELFAKWIGQK